MARAGMCSGRTGSMARALSGQKPRSRGAVGTPVSAAGVTAVPRCLEAWGHCTSSHRPRAEGDDLFLEMFTQFLSLQRGWGVCLRAGPPALPRCRGQRAGAPHLLSPGSRGTSTPTASSPMTRGCSPCRWVRGGGAPPALGGASEPGVGRMQLWRAQGARPPPRCGASSLWFVFCTSCRMRALRSHSFCSGPSEAASRQHNAS